MNKLIFDHKLISTKSVVANAILLVRDYSPNIVNSSSILDGLSESLGDNNSFKWRLPPTNFFKINVDGSAGSLYLVAALIWDYKGSFIQGEAKELHSCDPEEAEAMAFYMDLLLANNFLDMFVFLEGDNLSIVKLVNDI